MKVNRRLSEKIKIVIATSLVWLLLDAFLITYFMDCSTNCKPDSSEHVEHVKKDAYAIPPDPVEQKEPTKSRKSFLDRVFNRQEPQPGDNGQGVIIPKDKEAQSKEMYKINQFNLMASDMMSVNRTLPDYRSSSCLAKQYDIQRLPETSVVIVFHNEAWSTLLRSVHSIINRSPRNLLKEILLVDDASERDFLGEQLDKYVARLPVPTRVLRMGERSGLIRARLRGAKEATGRVLTFLDAHIECTDGWLPPLLHEIHLDRKLAIAPVIDRINLDSFAFEGSRGSPMVGGFKWGLSFHWIYGGATRQIPGRADVVRSPTMAGGLFSIERDYFYEIGSYDSGMDIWGGENLEMSFRIWMCGGQLLISSCSHVGHVFRKLSPYTWPGGVAKILNKNSMRTAQVWLDEYKHFYMKVNPAAAKADYGDVSERKRFREEHKCKSFSWYLENIYPEAHIPLRYYSLGELRLRQSGMCLDTMGHKAGDKVGLFPCHGEGGNQAFALTADLQLMSDEVCVSYGSWKRQLHFSTCNKQSTDQKFSYDPQTQLLRHSQSSMCLGPASATDNQAPTMVECDARNPALRWQLEGYKPLS